MKKGAKANYKLKGTSGRTKIKYYINNKKISSVNKKGFVKAKRCGRFIIIAKINGVKTKQMVYVISGRKMNVLKKTFNMYDQIGVKLFYSQLKRMQKNYADCSSFTWKACKAGKYYPGNKTYVPGRQDSISILKRNINY